MKILYGTIMDNTGIYYRNPIEFTYSDGVVEFDYWKFRVSDLNTPVYDADKYVYYFLSENKTDVENFIKGFQFAGTIVKEIFNV